MKDIWADGESGLPLSVLADHAPSEGWKERGQVPFLLAERAR
jgi:hypothetical protein